jgi:hypothetical protein
VERRIVSSPADPGKGSAGRTWLIVGAVAAVCIALVGGCVAAIFFTVSGVLKETDAYRDSVRQLEANAQVMEILGAPVTAGIPSGQVHTSGPSGDAQLAIPVTGTKTSGVLYVEATRRMGTWKTDRLELEVAGRAERIVLVGGTKI